MRRQSRIRKEPVVQRDLTTYVGLDVHKRTIPVSMVVADTGEVLECQEANDATVARRMARRMRRAAPGPVTCCYEARPTGYLLQRRLRAEGVMCVVIAPSQIPVRPGSRVKTDRRDARKLQELLEAGLLTEVHPPSEEQEALRDLCRCRVDVVQDLLRAHHCMSKFLLRRHCGFPGRNWGTRHMAWLRQLRFEDPASQGTLDSYLLAIDQLTERLRQLELQMGDLGSQEPYREPVGWLRCFRGIDTVTAVSLVAELHDFRRFRSARALMSYLGLVPSETSSGDRECRGGITKTGNGHARRYLVEAAWHQRHRPAISLQLRKRREGQPAWVLAIADRAQERLWRQWYRMTFHGKPTQKVVVAMARELAGYIWAVLQGPPLPEAE
ncbi:MAG: IS110 family transposase [Candidatus Eisenbacteria bacterium]|nr:IS110 family transposase [Candidatus Eisenbacteria bacterium]